MYMFTWHTCTISTCMCATFKNYYLGSRGPMSPSRFLASPDHEIKKCFSNMKLTCQNAWPTKNPRMPQTAFLEKIQLTQFRLIWAHLAGLHYEEVALDSRGGKKVVDFVQVNVPEAKVETSKITQSSFTQGGLSCDWDWEQQKQRDEKKLPHPDSWNCKHGN